MIAPDTLSMRSVDKVVGLSGLWYVHGDWYLLAGLSYVERSLTTVAEKGDIGTSLDISGKADVVELPLLAGWEGSLGSSPIALHAEAGWVFQIVDPGKVRWFQGTRCVGRFEEPWGTPTLGVGLAYLFR